MGASRADRPGRRSQGPELGGFTLLLDLGVGLQHDDFFDQTETGRFCRSAVHSTQVL